MTLFILDILITNLTYILTGKYFLNKLLKIDQQDAIKSAIFGIGVISFISLLLNFFVPLNYLNHFFRTRCEIFFIWCGFNL